MRRIELITFILGVVCILFVIFLYGYSVFAYYYEDTSELYTNDFSSGNDLNDQEGWYNSTPAKDYWFAISGGTLNLSADDTSNIGMTYTPAEDWLYPKVHWSWDVKFSEVFDGNDFWHYFTCDGASLWFAGNGTQNYAILNSTEVLFMGTSTDFFHFDVYLSKKEGEEFIKVYIDDVLTADWDSEDEDFGADQVIDYWRVAVDGNATNDGTMTLDNFQVNTFVTLEDFDVEVVELPDWQGNIQIGSETTLQYNKYTYCYLDDDCNFKINYGYDSIGGYVTLVTKDDYDIVGTTTELTDQQLLQITFPIDDPGEEQSENYCITYVSSTTEEMLLFCDVQIQWIDLSWCNEETVCADVATSSDFLYGVQCGARQTICWLFNPTEGSIEFFSKQIQNFESSFPFNLAFDLINEVSDTMDSATTTGAEFGMISVDEEGEYTMVYGIDSNSYYDVLGTSTINLITTYATYFIWIIVSVVITLIIVFFGIL